MCNSSVTYGTSNDKKSSVTFVLKRFIVAGSLVTNFQEFLIYSYSLLTASVTLFHTVPPFSDPYRESSLGENCKEKKMYTCTCIGSVMS